MQKFKRSIMKVLMVILLSSSIFTMPGVTTSITAQAAVNVPAVKETKKTLYVGSDTYKIEIKNKNKNASVVYKSNDSKVAKVSKTGIVTPVAQGSAKIGVTVKQNNKVYNLSLTITVKNAYIELTSSTDHMYVQDVYQFKADAYGLKGKIVWSVSDKKVASIDTDGKLTALSAGTVTVNAKSGNKSAKLEVIVELKELSSTEIYKKCGPATVEIKTDTKLGSGFFIDNGIVVTNYHVIRGAETISVTTADKTQYDVQKILGYDQNIDLAILQINSTTNPVLSMSKDDVEIGQDIYTLGSPLGLTNTMTKGMVSTNSRIIDNVDYIQIDAPISPGNSGGPLVNIYGEVIGINTWGLDDGQNLNFAINIKEIEKITTDKPLTVTEYNKIYSEQILKEFMDNLILETADTQGDGQKVVEGRGISGSLTSTQKGDLYYFYVDEPGFYSFLCFLDTFIDMKNTYFDISDSNWNDVSDTYENNDGNYLSVDNYLTPGYYYIWVSQENVYMGPDISYMFVYFYEGE